MKTLTLRSFISVDLGLFRASSTAAWLAQLGERQTNTQGFSITEKKVPL